MMQPPPPATSFQSPAPPPKASPPPEASLPSEASPPPEASPPSEPVTSAAAAPPTRQFQSIATYDRKPTISKSGKEGKPYVLDNDFLVLVVIAGMGFFLMNE